ncbi:MAG: helix-turn-helix domain-containing protein [Methanobacteriota archaeon]|nr:MAG: helix-turn-helix domain-containing protein [Euryarchaeota archaeon]
MRKLKAEIAGDIILSGMPGESMRKWREIFEISQSDLAEYLKVSPSTISDYESGRRKNPGVMVIKRFVDALFDIDSKRGGHIIKRLKEDKEGHEEYFEVHEFSKAISLKEFTNIIDGKIVSGDDSSLDKIKLYGYVVLHSIKVMLEMPEELFNVLNMHTVDKAFMFLEVSTGRSPLIVIRIAPNKPRAVVLHGIDKVDELAKKISQREGIPIIVTKKPIAEIKKQLNL